MSLKHGVDAKVYINIGTHPSPSWSEADLFESVTPNGGWKKAEIKIRRSRVDMGAKTRINIDFTGRMLCDDTDSNYQLLVETWKDLTATVDLLVLDGPIETEGSFGYRADFQISNGAQDQPSDNVLYRDFEAIAYPTANPPVWVTCTGGGAFTEEEI